MASFSDVIEKKVLDHLSTKAAYTPPNAPYLALCTVVPDDTSTGASITEAGYTGYARKQVVAADWSSAAGAAAEIHNAVSEAFAACSAGSSTIIGWALVYSSSGAGDVMAWGTCTSTVISTTQTPATVAASGLSVSLD